MAGMSLSVATITATRTFGDAVAQQRLELFLRYHGGPTGATAQEKLDWVLDKIVDIIIDDAKRQLAAEERAKRDAAISLLLAELDK